MESNQFVNFIDILQFRAKHNADQPAFIFLKNGTVETDSLTYQQLDCLAKAIALALNSRYAQGDRVLLIYPPSLEFIPAFLGCLYAGIVAIPIYPPRPNRSLLRLQAIINNAQAQGILTTTSLHEKISKQLTNLPELSQLSWLTTNNVEIQETQKWHKPLLTPDSLAFLQYTSGSTGNPKGVIISHANLIHNQSLIQNSFQNQAKTFSVNWLPLFHDMGLIGNVLQPLSSGVTCVLMPPLVFLQHPYKWLAAISHYQATTSGGPNFAYDLCVRKITAEQKANLDLSSWQIAFNGAEKIKAETIANFSRYFADCGFRPEAFYPCYGMAEATLFITGGSKIKAPLVIKVDQKALTQNAVIITDSLADSCEIVSCGKIDLGQKIMIVDSESLTPCAENQVGEIWVSGKSVAQGYWQQPEATQRTFQACLSSGEGSFLRTGDLGFIHQGELFITGRLKEIIIMKGRNYYPQDFEQTVTQTHQILQGFTNAAFMVEIATEKCLIIAQEIDKLKLKNLNIDETVGDICQAIMNNYELRVYDFLLLKKGQIPQTSSGKIQRYLCQQKFREGSFQLLLDNISHPALGKNRLKI